MSAVSRSEAEEALRGFKALVWCSSPAETRPIRPSAHSEANSSRLTSPSVADTRHARMAILCTCEEFSALSALSALSARLLLLPPVRSDGARAGVVCVNAADRLPLKDLWTSSVPQMKTHSTGHATRRITGLQYLVVSTLILWRVLHLVLCAERRPV
ncbi:hypothetical protein EYF80_019688 [Liparis tanakae]|uniref:Uncharacterized protein n=1 Tax=Liparis tanakae TaxID=230148 RepID=A0A4Z2HYJ6_9TELE|nr:hypothetical protein EYF80_019688 [Liparis tanakae]